MGVGYFDIYMVKQFLIHKIAIAVGVLRREPSILVEIYGTNRREIQSPFLIKFS
jgi:hypothetical protein